mmetsp:Transcript_54742/g.125177  ORF Transcript_54742/g.125177 Transcript_54742/m.125177 type:complete len:104 (+) Transcript_54742:135-446(+)
MAAFRALLVLLALPLARSQITSKACADNCWTAACAAHDFDCMWLCLQGCPKGHVVARAAEKPRLGLGELDDEARRRAISEMEAAEEQHRARAPKQTKSIRGAK